MTVRVVDAEGERQKRALRVRIGRLRRRIDGRVGSVEQEARRLTSWQTFVRRYPGAAVTAALGIGLAASAGLSRGRLWRWLGLRMLRRAGQGLTDRFWDELRSLWTESAPKRDAGQSSGADHEQGRQ